MNKNEMIAIVIAVALISVLVRYLQGNTMLGEGVNKISTELF
jgi:hypothetical protein